MVAEGSSVSLKRSRADARRNHDLVLAAARSVFAEDGADASLEKVARRAGVGIGTVYRHFPTRQALLEATMRDGLDRLAAHAGELAAAVRPRDALVTWLRELLGQTTTFRGLAASVTVTMLTEGTELYHSCHAMKDAAGRLLRRAQDAGEIRADLELAELLLLVHGAGWAAEQVQGGAERAGRLLALLTEGLEPRRP